LRGNIWGNIGQNWRQPDESDRIKLIAEHIASASGGFDCKPTPSAD
jgi:hypothetical protein